MSGQPTARSAKPDGHISWLEKTFGGMTGAIERAVFMEEHARKAGWLQYRDPRAKLLMFVAVVLAASLSSSLWILAALYLLILIAARASQMPFDFFVRRVWLGIPFFAGIVILPSIFLTAGPKLFALPIGSAQVGPSIPGLIGAAIFVARVGVSVSLAVLLVLTTPWTDLLKGLQSLRVPHVFILLFSMSYRYIFLFLHTANGMLEARKSRTVGKTRGGEQRGWISGTMGSLMNRAFKMSNDVYAAMLARGFTGQVRSYQAYRMRAADWAALGLSLVVAAAAIIGGRFI